MISAARMRAAIDLEQALAVDAGIDLRGRERGMAEQLLDRAQIAAARKQMRSERMPQRMRRGAVGQSQRAAHPLHGELDDARTQGAAAGADKDRRVLRERMRADRDII